MKNGFNGRETASAIADFIPIVGNVKGAYEATFGKDPITGRKLDKAERVAAGAAVIGGPLVKGGTRSVKVVSGIVSGGKKSSGKVPVAKGTDNLPSRNGAFNEAKRDAGIPRGQQPEAVNRVDMRTAVHEGGHVIKDSNGNVISTREYVYTNKDGKKIVIQDHSAGHEKGGQGPHFNVRPSGHTRTGKVPGAKEHYPFNR